MPLLLKNVMKHDLTISHSRLIKTKIAEVVNKGGGGGGGVAQSVEQVGRRVSVSSQYNVTGLG